jgi:hypothetical protein
MHRPAQGLENELLRAIGKSGPAPQGIAVLNADGQVLDWVLMFDDDPSVLKFLDHAKARFAEHPDGAKPFTTERYQRFPGSKRDDVPAHTLKVPTAHKHSADDRCPADSVYQPGTVIAKVVGRRVTGDGKLTPDTVNQEDYAQDKFIITPGTQQQLADALAKADGKRTAVPDTMARLWASYAYMGMLDVRPLNNPAGADSSPVEIAFHIEPHTADPAWHRITGTTHLAVKKERRKGDGAGFENNVQLHWTGFARLEKDRLIHLLLRADGTERLYWHPGGAPGAIARGPEVANLPGGRHVDWKGPVSFSIIGTPAKPSQPSTSAPPSPSPQPNQQPRGNGAPAAQSLRAKMQQWQALNIEPRERMKLMQKLRPLIETGKLPEAEALLDQALRE